MVDAEGPVTVVKGRCNYWEAHWPCDDELLARAVRSALPSPNRGKVPRWSFVMDRFMAGSTLAHALCRRFGLNPDDIKDPAR